MPRAKKAAETQIVGVKGFDKDFRCLGYQYAVGETYEHDGRVVLCSSGFHCIDGNPLDVLDFYPLIAGDGSLNRFASVTASGEIKRDSSSKIVCGKLTVSAELKIPDLIGSAVKFVMDACKGGGGNAQAASGNYSQLAASGYSSQLAASGNYSQLAASGNYSKLAASGYSSQLAASGYSSKLAASGYSSQLAASGDSSKLAASGYSSQLAASGKDSVIAAAAPGCTATGANGTWISLAEFDSNGKCIGFATGCIGRDGLKPDTAYIARGGKLVEVR